MKIANVSVMESDLAPGETVHFPSRWTLYRPQSVAESKRELNRLAETINTGARAVIGVYMRLCDTVRQCGLSDAEVREELGKHFPSSRVAEILRVSHAPPSVYDRYTAGFFSFKAALAQCRLYHLTPTAELRQRRLRKVADRLVTLMGGPGEVTVKDRRVTVE